MNFVQFSDIYLTLLILDDLQNTIRLTEIETKLLIIVEIF